MDTDPNLGIAKLLFSTNTIPSFVTKESQTLYQQQGKLADDLGMLIEQFHPQLSEKFSEVPGYVSMETHPFKHYEFLLHGLYATLQDVAILYKQPMPTELMPIDKRNLLENLGLIKYNGVIKLSEYGLKLARSVSLVKED